MKAALRTVLCLGLVGALIAAPQPLLAKTHHHHSSHSTSNTKPAVNWPDAGVIKAAQQHLAHLGFYGDKIDGAVGPHTKSAIRAFQTSQGYPVDGILTYDLYRALIRADHGVEVAEVTEVQPIVTPPVDFYEAHKDSYGYINPEYSNVMQMAGPPVVGVNPHVATQTMGLPTRYGKIDLSLMDDSTNRFVLSLNGQHLMHTDMQPAVVGVSRTYQVGDDDVIIVTTFRSEDTVCAYNNWLVIADGDGAHVERLKNCTSGYQAHVQGEQLVINFPHPETGDIVGQSWHYESGGEPHRL